MVASFTAGRPGHQRRPTTREGKQTMSEAEAASSRPEPARDARDVPTATPGAPAKARVIARGVNVYYGDNHALKQVDIDIHKNEVVSFIGPSGCGKSTFLRRSEEHTSELQSLMRSSYAVFCLKKKKKG